MSKQNHGLVIAFDGPDGVGKTTQVKLTADYLVSLGHDVHTTRASGGTPIGEALRKVSLSDTNREAEVDVYISLAMHTALGNDLIARKKAGQICIVDRSPLAVLAYNVYGSQLSDKRLGYGAAETLLKLWPLDGLFIFSAPQQVIDERRETRVNKLSDYFEKLGDDYFLRVQEGYRAAMKFMTNTPELKIPVTTIDAAPDADTIQQHIRQQIKKML